MTVSSILALSTPPIDSLFFVLFLAFAIAMVIWLILWMLAKPGEEEEAKSSGSSTEKKASPAKKEVAAPVKVAEKKEPVPVAEKDGSSKDGKKAESSKPEAQADEVAEKDSIDTASEEEAAQMFSSELDSGLVTQDPVYGIIYKEAPSEADDLKKIKGVAKVLEGKLNGIGVYRFKQVAVWTDAACAEFSKLLTFKNRIYQDDWIAQAKEFHEDKYDEKL
jgi:predicted flap endonuclease-1-like 5' DNA nuclease